MSQRTSRPLVAVAAAVGGLLFAAGAAAGDSPGAMVAVNHVVVTYVDLDLDTERGTVVLQRRLESAARRVCGTPQVRDLREAQEARACAAAAIARAVADVGSPRLTARHASRNGGARG